VDTKPFMVMLESLKSRNAKFVLFGLAFVAEIALTRCNESDEPHELLKYIQENALPSPASFSQSVAE